MKANEFYKIDYIPNKLVFIYEITNKDIKFIAFLKENNSSIKGVKHSVNKCNSKDFNRIKKPFAVTPEIKKMIDNCLN